MQTACVFKPDIEEKKEKKAAAYPLRIELLVQSPDICLFHYFLHAFSDKRTKRLKAFVRA
jgi:hypothetical protein